MMQSFIQAIEIFEYSILVEDRGRIEFLLKTYGSKLEAKYNSNGEIIGSINDVGEESVQSRIVQYINTYDPSHNGQFTQWMILRYLKSECRLEDLEAVRDYLVGFINLKKTNQLGENPKDINQYSVSDLEKVVEKQEKAIIATSSDEETRMLQQSKILIQNKDIRILVPLTQAAACYFGRNTDWCTAWGNHKELGLSHPGRHPGRTNHYNSYVTDSNDVLYIIELFTPVSVGTSANLMLLQYHSRTSQFMDAADRPIDNNFLKKLLQEYPVILKAIGEERFAASHLKVLGLSFFSPKIVENLDDYTIINAIDSQESYNAIPDNKRNDPRFIALFLYHKPESASYVPKDHFNSAVAEKFREITDRQVRLGDLLPRDKIWAIFNKFPIKEWSQTAIILAIDNGRLTYDQFMEIPEDQRDNQLLIRLIRAITKKNPENITTFPKGLVAQLDIGFDLLKENFAVIQFLGEEDITEQDIINYIDDESQNQFRSVNFFSNFAYVPPERLTHKIIDHMNKKLGQYNKLEYDQVQIRLRDNWKATLAEIIKNRKGNIEDRQNKEVRETLPKRYIHDVSFINDALSVVAFHGTARHSHIEHSHFYTFILLVKLMNLPIDTKTLEMSIDLLAPITASSPGSFQVEKYRSFFKEHEDKWNSHIIKTALTKKILVDDDIPDKLITPDVAARIFALSPRQSKNKEYAYEADDESLVAEITHNNNNAFYNLIDYVPDDRITEPVAYAAVSIAHVANAKKRFPKDALSKRVYYAGVPWTFSIKDVPKRFRSNDLLVRAVSKNPDEIRYVPNALEWLNKNYEELPTKDIHWCKKLERYDFIELDGHFESLEKELPSVQLQNGYLLVMADKRKEKLWFLKKDGDLIAKLTIKNKKLTLENARPIKDLFPVFFEIAQRFLKDVDITVLNRIGIYRDREGNIVDKNQVYNTSPKKIIDGLNWSETPHLKGKLYTAWKDDKALLKIYKAGGTGWGHYTNIMREIEILDWQECLDNASAIIKGIENISRDVGYIKWTLTNIGIEWSKSAGFWLSREHRIGKIGEFEVFYNKAHRYISVFSKRKERLVAHAHILKNGKLAKDYVHYTWYTDVNGKKESDQVKQEKEKLLRNVLDSMAEKINQKN